MPTRVLTVTRQVGTAGEEVARLVAERLGFRYLDYQIVQRAAREAGVLPETIIESERAPSLLRRVLESLARTPSAPAEGWNDPVPILTNPGYIFADYRAFIETGIRDIAAEGNAVLVGHISQIVLHGRDDTLHLLVTGSLPFRVRRVMAGMDIGEKAAIRTIERTDAERQEFFQRTYGTNWLSPWNYDLCINTDRVDPEHAARLVESAARP